MWILFFLGLVFLCQPLLIFFNQIVLVGGIPFPVTIPKPPADIDISQMTEQELHAKLQKGYDDYQAGRVRSAAEAFAEFMESHR